MQEPALEYDARFDIPPEEVPYASIALAAFLMMFGLVAFVLAWLHFTQRVFGKEQAVSRCQQHDSIQMSSYCCGVLLYRRVVSDGALRVLSHRHGLMCL